MKLTHLIKWAHAIVLCLLTGIAGAQTNLYTEGTDMSNTPFGNTHNITSAGTYTVIGGLGTPSDGQDWHQVNIGSGLQLTGVTYSVSGGGGFSGGWGFAGCCGNTISGNASGSFTGASYPLGTGTYYTQMFANFSVGNSYVVTYTVTSAAVPPSITSHPPNRTICAGSNTTFTVSANNATSYQWQVNTGSGFGNITNGGVYSGATTTTLTITGATAGMNGYLYRCIATGAASPAATSNSGTLTVNSAPAITVQPPNRTICSGSNTTFTVSASNATGYQWQVNTGSGFANITNGGVYSGATTATLTITGATAGMNGYLYRCVASGSCTPSATSNSGTLTVNSAPVITVQPPNRTICEGTNTTFTVTASNTTGYQWQVNTGSGFGNITNGGVYSGATTATLTITGATAGMNGYLYRCVASGSCTPSATSNSGTLTVDPLPAISAQPPNRTICAGDNTTFTVTASNTTGYQWQVNTGSGFGNITNGGVYSGTTTATLTITGATAGMNTYTYRCVTTNSCGSINSNAGTLTVNTAPNIAVHPSNSTICEGTNTSFSVTAAGTALTYQWQVHNGTSWSNVSNTGIYSGAITSTLSLTAATSAVNTYQYRCIVNGTCAPAATSNAATLTINTAPVITGQPGNSTICENANTSFGVTATGASLTYQWQVSTNGGGLWTNITNTGIYSGTTTATLSLTAATSTVNGYQYRCVVSGICTPAATSNAATLNINTAPVVTAQPANSAICAGTNTSFSVTATGTSLTYQWQVHNGTSWSNVSNTGIYSGATSTTLNLTGATAAVNTFQYRCVVSGTCTPAATTNAATLTINTAPAITAQPANSTICPGNNTSFSVTATGTALTYQWQVSTNGGGLWTNLTNTGIYSGTTTATLNLTAATSTVNGYQYRCVVSGSCTPATTSNAAILTINLVPAITAQPGNSTICSGNNTSFSVTATGTALTYQWQVSTNGGSLWTNLTNTGIYSGTTIATLNLTGATTAQNGYQYRCVVSGTCTPAATSNAAILNINTAPAITAQPGNSTICENTNTSFNVTAIGTALTYQWQVSTNGGGLWTNLTNTGIYSGAATATLSLTAATTTINGYQYRCIVSGTCTPGVTSNTASISINTLPTITAQPANSTICSGNNTSFSVTATGTALTYQWQVSTNGGGLWTNITNTGIYSGTSTATLNLTGAAIAQNGYQYRCVVSGTCTPATTSNAAILNINTAPAITAQPGNSTICENTNTSFSVTATGTALTYQWQISTNGGGLWTNITNTGIYSGTTTATLNLTVATTAVNSYQYRCVVSGTCTPQATSNAATLTINTAPVITSQPQTDTICVNTGTTFSVATTGTGLTYQWQVSTNNGTSWTNLANGGIYSGVATSALALTNATVAVHTYRYRCVVSGTCAPSQTSAAATLYIKTTPVVTLQPTSTIVCLGNNTSYSVAGTSTFPVNYQWQGSVNGTTWLNIANGAFGAYTGVNTPTLNVSGVYSGLFSMYRCVLSNGCIPVPTNTASLTIETAPLISINPTDQVKCVGQNASFAISATGSNITYQWQESTNGGSTWNNVANGGVYSGAATNNLILTAPPATMNAYRYRCMVTGSCPTVKTSASATLTVNTLVAINTNTPTALTYCSGSNTSLTVGATGTGMSYRWYRNINGVWTALNNGGIYSGVTTATLNITGISAATNTVHYLFRCVITGTCNMVSTNTTDITVQALPAIASNPSSVTRCDSTGSLGFKVTATGSALVYQWQLNTGNGWNNLVNNSTYSGVNTPNLELANVYYSMNGYQYRCVVTGICTPTATSSVATLTVNQLIKPSVVVNVTNDDICTGSSVTFTPAPTNGGTNPSYVWKRNGATVGTGSSYTTATLANGDQVWCDITSNITCPSPKTVKSNNTITMKVTPYSTPTIVVTSDVGTSWCSGKPAVFRANITNGGPTPYYEWQVNGLVVGANVDTYLTTQLLNGDQVRCRLTSSLKCPSPAIVTSNTLTMTINQTTRSSIVIAPNPDSVICENVEVTMYAYFTNGGTTPSFQWVLNGQDIPGMTSGTLKTNALNNGDTIQCRFISNATCVFPEISNPVVFSVLNPVDPSVNVTVIYMGNNTYRFTALPVNGGQNPTYQWYKNTVPIPGATAAFYDAANLLKTDKITVVMTSSEPCVSINKEKVESRTITTAVSEFGNSFGELGLYPNPNKGQFSIKGTLNKSVADKDIMVRITNSLGQTVYTQAYRAAGANIDLPVQLQHDLPNGMYQVNVAIDDNVTNLRFVLNR